MKKQLFLDFFGILDLVGSSQSHLCWFLEPECPVIGREHRNGNWAWLLPLGLTQSLSCCKTSCIRVNLIVGLHKFEQNLSLHQADEDRNEKCKVDHWSEMKSQWSIQKYWSLQQFWSSSYSWHDNLITGLACHYMSLWVIHTGARQKSDQVWWIFQSQEQRNAGVVQW